MTKSEFNKVAYFQKPFFYNEKRVDYFKRETIVYEKTEEWYFE